MPYSFSQTHHWQTKLSQLAIIDMMAATGLESQSNFKHPTECKKKKQPQNNVHWENKILIKCKKKITFCQFHKFEAIRNVVTLNTSHFPPKIGHTVWSKCSFSTSSTVHITHYNIYFCIINYPRERLAPCTVSLSLF